VDAIETRRPCNIFVLLFPKNEDFHDRFLYGLLICLRWFTTFWDWWFYSSLRTALFSRARVGSASE